MFCYGPIGAVFVHNFIHKFVFFIKMRFFPYRIGWVPSKQPKHTFFCFFTLKKIYKKFFFEYRLIILQLFYNLSSLGSLSHTRYAQTKKTAQRHHFPLLLQTFV